MKTNTLLWIIIIILVIVFFPLLAAVGVAALPILIGGCLVAGVVLLPTYYKDYLTEKEQKREERNRYLDEEEWNNVIKPQLVDYLSSNEDAEKLFLSLDFFRDNDKYKDASELYARSAGRQFEIARQAKKELESRRQSLLGYMAIDENRFDEIIDKLQSLGAINIESDTESEDPIITVSNYAKNLHNSMYREYVHEQTSLVHKEIINYLEANPIAAKYARRFRGDKNNRPVPLTSISYGTSTDRKYVRDNIDLFQKYVTDLSLIKDKYQLRHLLYGNTLNVFTEKGEIYISGSLPDECLW